MQRELGTWLDRAGTFARALRFEAVGRGASLGQLADARPIRIDGRAPSVLALHGFCGVPGEVRVVTDAAAALGLATSAPLLAGHGTHPRDLASLRFADWVSGVRTEFDRLRREGPVVLVGLSLGSLIATELYLSAPGDVAGLGLLASAFWIRDPFPGTALDCVDQLGIRDFGMPKAGPDIGDPTARATHVGYDIQPVHAAISVRRAGQRLRDELFRVHCPTLVLHGARDRVTPVSGAFDVASRLGTSDRRTVILPESHHVLTRDAERDQVRAELGAFFRRLAEGQFTRAS